MGKEFPIPIINNNTRTNIQIYQLNKCRIEQINTHLCTKTKRIQYINFSQQINSLVNNFKEDIELNTKIF